MTADNRGVPEACIDGEVALDMLERRQRRLPYEMVRGCFEGPVSDGYQGPPIEDAFELLAYASDWQRALMQLTALSSLAIHRIAQHEQRTPIEVLDELWPERD